METNIYKKLFEVKKAGIKLQRDTKAFNYKYAELSQIQEKLGDELQKQGLLVKHFIKNNEVFTRIIDTDTEKYVESGIELTPGTKAQDKGSEITYYRRYNLLSLLDLEVVDDDGKKAQDSKPKETETNDNLPWFADENYDNFVDKIKENFTNGKDAVKFCRTKYKVNKEYASRIEGLYN